ncbi:MAG: hypothetical protein KIT09_35600 [Bryobacteraceae bacterium]|nr:hypothetical protein [Bryobacteraceae bacterium]
MRARRRVEKRILWVLVAGFSLSFLLLVASAQINVQAARAIERRNAALHERHRLDTRAIFEIQGEEAGLSGLFYALAAEPDRLRRAELQQRLSDLEARVQNTLAVALASPAAERWLGVKSAVENFIVEARRALDVAGTPNNARVGLYRAHEELVSELSDLVARSYQGAIEEEVRAGRSGHSLIRQALIVLAVALVLAILAATVTVKVALQMFQRAEWQARELSRLSAHVFETQEQTLHRFSHELHDQLGQTLTAIEANLAAVPAAGPAQASRIEDCQLLVKDAIGNVRELSQLLRPSTLDDFGLASSLQCLIESYGQRTGIEIEQQLEFEGRLSGEAETHLYRIAQEALTNVSRHSGASRVSLRLVEQDGVLRLTVADNGRGLPRNGRSRSGFGLIGMRERMRAAGGDLRIESGPGGVNVVAELSLNATGQSAKNPSLVGG